MFRSIFIPLTLHPVLFAPLMVIQTNTDGQSYRGKVNVAERGKKSVEEIQGVQEKLCSFTIRCNPSLAYIANVQSLLLAGNCL